jgi:hypothetical protein
MRPSSRSESSGARFVSPERFNEAAIDLQPPSALARA